MKNLVIFAVFVCSFVFNHAEATTSQEAATYFQKRKANSASHKCIVVKRKVKTTQTLFWATPKNPVAKIDPTIDPKLRNAAAQAEKAAHSKSREECWHYVKEALWDAGVVASRPVTVYAKEAGDELVRNYHFIKSRIQNPFQAPVGAVLVYSNGKAAGHVEIRTRNGFASDYRSKFPRQRPLIGVFVKPRS